MPDPPACFFLIDPENFFSAPTRNQMVKTNAFNAFCLNQIEKDSDLINGVVTQRQPKSRLLPDFNQVPYSMKCFRKSTFHAPKMVMNRCHSIQADPHITKTGLLNFLGC